MLAPVGRGACVLRRRRQTEHAENKKARILSFRKSSLTCLALSFRALEWHSGSNARFRLRLLRSKTCGSVHAARVKAQWKCPCCEHVHRSFLRKRTPPDERLSDFTRANEQLVPSRAARWSNLRYQQHESSGFSRLYPPTLRRREQQRKRRPRREPQRKRRRRLSCRPMCAGMLCGNKQQDQP